MKQSPLNFVSAFGDNFVRSLSSPLPTQPEDGFASLVSCQIDLYKDTKAVKKTLTIPSWLNDRAMSMGVNFSLALQEALISKIQL